MDILSNMGTLWIICQNMGTLWIFSKKNKKKMGALWIILQEKGPNGYQMHEM